MADSVNPIATFKNGEPVINPADDHAAADAIAEAVQAAGSGNFARMQAAAQGVAAHTPTNMTAGIVAGNLDAAMNTAVTTGIITNRQAAEIIASQNVSSSVTDPTQVLTTFTEKVPAPAETKAAQVIDDKTTNGQRSVA